MSRLALVSALALCGALSLPVGRAAADCTFVVDGHVRVEHQLPELVASRGASSPLVGVQVRVQSRARVLGVWGTWSSWPDATTDSAGFFSRARTTGCGAHQVRVYVKFDDAQLEIRHARSGSSLVKVLWYQVFESGTIDSGADQHLDVVAPLTFGAGRALELGSDEPRAHADIWVLYHQALAALAGLGDGLGFADKVKIKFPHDGIADDGIEASYANPMNGVIYIFPGSQPLAALTDDMLHELMHLWAYQHSRGEGGMAWDLIGLGVLSSLGLVDGDGFDTHGFETNPGVAFHEGFAEHASIQLMRMMFGEATTRTTFGLDLWRPFNRTAFSEQLDVFERDTLTTFAELEHFDAGWQTVLATLLTANPDRWNFGAPSTAIDHSLGPSHLVSSRITLARACPTTWLTFTELLRLFVGASVSDRSDDWAMGDMSWAGLGARARSLGLMSASDLSFYEALLDPSSSAQAEALETCTPLVVPLP